MVCCALQRFWLACIACAVADMLRCSLGLACRARQDSGRAVQCRAGQGLIFARVGALFCACAQHTGDHGVDAEGWFSTGDVATIDPWGHMAITDRSKVGLGRQQSQHGSQPGGRACFGNGSRCRRLWENPVMMLCRM